MATKAASAGKMSAASKPVAADDSSVMEKLDIPSTPLVPNGAPGTAPTLDAPPNVQTTEGEFHRSLTCSH